MMEKTMQSQPQPQRRRLEPFRVAGLTARTTNRDESDPQAARIGTLWDRFFGERVYEKTPHRVDDMRLFGVYSDYEADAHGAFDITTGVAVADGPASVRIEGGDYLVFHGHGEMPQMVLAVWQAVWHYFDAHPEIQRRYKSDFEAYSGPDQVAIHIGILTD
jgi:predicted transcriptional regulator YdeE